MLPWTSNHVVDGPWALISRILATWDVSLLTSISVLSPKAIFVNSAAWAEMINRGI